MELYSSEAFVRDIVNAISSSEGKPVNIGGTEHHKRIDRRYIFELISQAKKAVEGQQAPLTPKEAKALRGKPKGV
jgi:hypothetical protein